MMREMLIQLAAALCGSFGFALLFNHKGRNIAVATLGGVLTWGVYLLCESFSENLFLLNLLAAAFAAAYSEAMARVCKTPATAFLMTSIIPLVPGGSLYYTLLYVISKEEEAAQLYGVNTLLTATGIAVGLVLVSAAVRGMGRKYMK